MTMDMNRRIFLASAVGAGLAATATGAQETTPQNKPTGPGVKALSEGLESVAVVYEYEHNSSGVAGGQD